MTQNSFEPVDLYRVEAEARRLRAETLARWVGEARQWLSRQFKAAPKLRPTA